MISYWFIGIEVQAQNYTSLSFQEKRDIQLRSYILVHLDSIKSESLFRLMDAEFPLAMYLSNSEIKNESVLNRHKNIKSKILILNSKNLSRGLNSKELGINISKDEVDSLNLSRGSLNRSDFRFKENNDLGLLTIEPDLNVADSVFVNLWNRSGKLPNFIYANNLNLNSVVEIVTMLNKSKKVYGVIRTEDELLNDVSFENYKDRIVNGFFTFPYEGEAIIPHKAGYYFSPDIISPNAENRKNLKEFVGYSLDSDYRLTYNFTFNNEVKNSVKDGNNEFLSNVVISKKDKIHGNVGYFSNRAYIDTGIAGKSALRSNFSITAWLKPTELNAANAILSKGFNFVVKIHQGHLTFTSAGIKDYKSLSSPIPVNEWTHIGLVHSKINNDLTFYINGVQTDRIEMITEYENSEYNLLVGNNIWEEFFVGYLSDIKIWERELNANEVLSEFNGENNGSSKVNSGNLFVIAGGILVLIFVLISLRKKLKKKVNKVHQLVSTRVSHFVKGNFKEQILCFGQLKIENENGVNIANKFSPMLKKIFVIIFLHSHNRGNGISTKNLTEFIWPGMDVNRAKNTRGTTIQNLRSILSECTGVDLVFKDKLWYFELNDSCYCDFLEAQALFDLIKANDYSVEVIEREVPRLTDVLSNGRFFSNSSEPWLDSFVEKYSIELIEQCFVYVDKLNLEINHELLFAISEVIYLYDDLNEKALEIKLNVLTFQGKFSLARSVYDNFVSLYKKIYKEPYPTTFNQLLSKKQKLS